MRHRRWGSHLLPVVALSLAMVAGPVMANEIETPNINEQPLQLKVRGSFFVGGEGIEQTFVELGSQRAADRVTIGQMYVEYMEPVGATKAPIVLIHGAGQSGAGFDTTPDGRMGWFEYFVRRSHPTYVVDQVGRGRSGFDQSIFNRVGAGQASPDKQPKITRMGDRIASWINFRIGPDATKPYPDTQYPIEAVSALSRQGVPDLIASLPSPNPNYKALAALAKKLNGAILLGHSQAGDYPLEAALLDPKAVRAMVLVEPGRCNAEIYTADQIATLATIPLLVVYGDHLDTPTGIKGSDWPARFQECKRLIARLKKAGGQAEMLHPPELGIHGNTHLMMQDRNNLQIADLIIDWMETRAAGA